MFESLNRSLRFSLPVIFVASLLGCPKAQEPVTRTEAPALTQAIEELQIEPGEKLWLAPNEKTSLKARSGSDEDTLSWYSLGTDNTRAVLTQDPDYELTAPSLPDNCNDKEISLLAVATTPDGSEKTKKVSVLVQNPKCVVDEASGLSSNDTTKLLIGSDKSLYVGTKNGLTRFKNGKAIVMKKAGGDRPLLIITALAEAGSQVLVAQARKVLAYPLKGFGIERLSFRNNIPLWQDQALFENNFVSAIYFDKEDTNPFPQIILAHNYTRNGGVQLGSDVNFQSTTKFLKGESLYTILDMGQRSLYGGDGGLFVYEGDQPIKRYDGSQWGGKSGLFGATSNRSVRALTNDNAGNIWIGLKESMFARGGIIQFRPNSELMDTGSWSTAIKLPRGNDVRALAVDYKDRLWIATNKGLVLRGTNGSFENFAVNEGLPNEDIRDLSYDARTRTLWIATGGGVARWALELLE